MKKKRHLKRSSIGKNYDEAVRQFLQYKEGKYSFTSSDLVKIADAIVSKTIRESSNICILATVTKPWNCTRDIQCGHLISRSAYKVRYDKRNLFPQCLAFGHKVLTESRKYKNIEDVCVGDSILGFSKSSPQVLKSNKVLSKKVFVPPKLYEVSLENGQTIKCTPDHKFLCSIEGRNEWVEAEHIANMLHRKEVCNIITL